MEKLKVKLTAIIIARNEAERIGECIVLLNWVDKILVIDNGSNDKTVEIAHQNGITVLRASNKNFSELRNLGKTEANSGWLLYVDADELVTPGLKEEIQKVINQPDGPSGYYIKRKNYYLGHSWPYSDKLIRLMRTDKLKHWEGRVHETAVIYGTIGVLEEPLIHNSHRTLEEMVNKTNEWSDIEAQLRFETRHPKITWWRLIRVMITGFISSFFGQQGWRAGVFGLIESVYQAFSMFVTYAKLWELQKN